MNDADSPFPTDDEVEFMAALGSKMLGLEGMGHLNPLIDATDAFRAQPLAQCLSQAREANDWKVKFCAETLGAKQMHLKALEAANFRRPGGEVLGRYVALLGLQRVYAQWVEANPALVSKLGLPESVSAERAPGWPKPVSFLVLPGQFRMPPEVRALLAKQVNQVEGLLAGIAHPVPAPVQPPESAEPAVYQFKISLRNMASPVWRRVLVSNETTLSQLHEIIQAAMGWHNSHLHEFRLREQPFLTPHPDFGEDALDERRYRLRDLPLKPKTKLKYVYDFGDGWEHELLLETLLPPERGFVPVCLKGTGACPPEDCGGPWGYRQMLEAAADRTHPDQAEVAGWLGDFDPASFDLESVNARLAATGARGGAKRQSRRLGRGGG